MNTYQQISPYYENVEFNLSDGQTNYDLDSNQSTFLSSFGPGNATRVYPSRMQLRTNQTITFRINSTSNHAVTVASTDSPYVVEGVEIRNVFLTNASGSTAAVKLFFQNSPH